jgi:hypothetical protein
MVTLSPDATPLVAGFGDKSVPNKAKTGWAKNPSLFFS